MESRSITLTLEKAREWYNSGSSDLKEVALQAYTKEELTVPDWKNIKTFEDACAALGINPEDNYVHVPYNAGVEITNHLYAIYKLDIIRRALNQGWKPKMTKGAIYYPYVKFYPAGDKAEEDARSIGWYIKATFKADGNKYYLVGGDCYSCYGRGLSDFSSENGIVLARLGLLGCKSKEIAQHMSRYFAKEIFEACYAHHIGTYEWV